MSCVFAEHFFVLFEEFLFAGSVHVNAVSWSVHEIGFVHDAEVEEVERQSVDESMAKFFENVKR